MTPNLIGLLTRWEIRFKALRAYDGWLDLHRAFGMCAYHIKPNNPVGIANYEIVERAAIEICQGLGLPVGPRVCPNCLSTILLDEEPDGLDTLCGLCERTDWLIMYRAEVDEGCHWRRMNSLSIVDLEELDSGKTRWEDRFAALTDYDGWRELSRVLEAAYYNGDSGVYAAAECVAIEISQDLDLPIGPRVCPGCDETIVFDEDPEGPSIECACCARHRWMEDYAQERFDTDAWCRKNSQSLEDLEAAAARMAQEVRIRRKKSSSRL